MSSKAQANIKSGELKSAKSTAEEMTKSYETAEEELKQLKKNHEDQLDDMQRDHQYKVLNCLI